MTESRNVLSLRRAWPDLPVPTLEEMVGDLAASFVPPLQHLAPRGLAVVGLPRWHGKRFTRDGEVLHGVNLVREPTGLSQRLPMTARIGPSLADGRPALVVSYAANAPRPWRWVRDEVRVLDAHTYVGLTFVTLPGLRRLGGTPFLLSRED